MIIYIAGKITGDPDYKSKFAAAEMRLIKAGNVVLNPAKIRADLDYETYMQIGKALLDVADAIYILPNWTDSPGAKKEMEYARETGKDLYNIREIIDAGKITEEMFNAAMNAMSYMAGFNNI